MGLGIEEGSAWMCRRVIWDRDESENGCRGELDGTEMREGRVTGVEKC